MNEHVPNSSLEREAAQPHTRKIFVEKLETEAIIGILPDRRREQSFQPISISFELDVLDEAAPAGDSISEVVCYEKLIRQIRKLCSEGYFVTFLELAERAARLCLEDARVLSAYVCVRKHPTIDKNYPIGVKIALP